MHCLYICLCQLILTPVSNFIMNNKFDYILIYDCINFVGCNHDVGVITVSQVITLSLLIILYYGTFFSVQVTDDTMKDIQMKCLTEV